MTSKIKLNLFSRTVFLISSLFSAFWAGGAWGVSVNPTQSSDGHFTITIPSQYWGSDSSQVQILERVLLEKYIGPNGTSTTGYSESGGDLTSRIKTFDGKPAGEYAYSFYSVRRANSSGATPYQTNDPEVAVVNVTPSTQTAENVELSAYDIYYGDFNNDGMDGDIYFHAKDLFVLIASEISIPLFIPADDGFTFYRTSSGYTGAISGRLDSNELSNYTQLVEGQDYYVGDLNGDGEEDFFLRGKTSSDPGLSVIQRAIGYPDSYTAVVESGSGFNVSDRNNYIAVRDQNLDGRLDVVLLSGAGGVVWDTIYAATDGSFHSSNYYATNLDQIFDVNTKPVNTVGTLGGSFTVDGSGAATYAVPIYTPEGTADATPSVALTYNSQGGNGVIGTGWSLNAFGAVTRCAKNYQMDKVSKALQWNSQDQFCLNGQRLLVQTGSYGAAGSTYKTAVDSYSHISLHGSVNGGPDYFKVIAKDGSASYYGLTSGDGAGSGSKQTFSGGKTLSWNLALVKDSVGNPIRYFYEDENGNDFRLSKIAYAYGNSSSANTTIEFFYEGRPDRVSGYMAGVKSELNQRLKSIDVNNTVDGSTSTLRTYHLIYNLETADQKIKKRSLLTAIQACVENSCQAPTKFDWQLVTGSYSNEPIGAELNFAANDRGLKQFRLADINGDGLQDVVWLDAWFDKDFLGGSWDTELRYNLSYEGDLFNPKFSNEESRLVFSENLHQETKLEILDYNVDGRMDVAVYRTRGSNAHSWEIYLSIPWEDAKTNWRLSASPIVTNLTDQHGAFIDVNGDGLVDFLGTDKVYLLQKKQSCINNPNNCDYSSNTFYEFRVEDGTDGSNPWLGIDSQFLNTNGPWDDSFMIGECTDQAEWVYVKTSGELRVHSVGDFNGDGRQDIVGGQYLKGYWQHSTRPDYCGWYHYSYKEKLYVLVQTDNGMEVETELGVRTSIQRGNTGNFKDVNLLTSIVDANSDGLADLIVRTSDESDEGEGSGSANLYISNGKGFNDAVNLGSFSDKDDFGFTDYNMDGFPDLFVRTNTTQNNKSQLKVYLWDSVDENYSYGYSIPVNGGEDSMHVFMDLDGDGLSDRVSLVDSKLQRYLFEPGPSGGMEAISGFDNGRDGYTSVTYEPINTSDHYSGMDIDLNSTYTEKLCYTGWSEEGYADISTCTYVSSNADEFYEALNRGLELPSGATPLSSPAPVVEVNGPMYVVTKASTNVSAVTLNNDMANPSGNTGGASNVSTQQASKDYFYSNAKAQAGVGFLGFHSIKTIDNQTDIEVVGTFRQDFPFVGTPRSQYVFAPGGTRMISESHSITEVLNLPSNANDIVMDDGVAELGSLRIANTAKYDISYSMLSSLATGGQVQFYTQPASNSLIGCNANVCPKFSHAVNSQTILQQVITQNVPDPDGNSETIIVTTSGQDDIQTITTENEYGPGTLTLHGVTLSYSQLGRLTKTTVSRIKNGVAEPDKFTEFTYYTSGAANGMLKTEVIAGIKSDGSQYALGSDKHLLSTYDYDPFGNINLKSVQGWDGVSVVNRESTSNYDTTGRYLIWSKNALDHTVKEVIERNEYGAALTVKGLNGAEAYANYDEWGRETYTASNDGSWATTEYKSCPESGLNCPSHAVTAVVRSAAGSNGVASVTYLDSLGQKVRISSQSFDGQMVNVDSEFDVSGRLMRQSEPYFEGSNPNLWTRNYYDQFGKLILALAPSGAIGHFANVGFSTAKTNDLGQTNTNYLNGFGELVRSKANDGGEIEYDYNTDGSVKTITVVPNLSGAYHFGNISGLCQQPTSNQQTVFCYDELGRKTQMWSPDKGHWHYEYNAFGELISQTDANGQVVETTFDILGRAINRTDYLTTSAIEGHTHWKYDQELDGSPALGLLTQVIYSEGQVATTCSAGKYCESVKYDSLGRFESSKTTMPDGKEYSASNTYDSIGRVEYQYNAMNGILKRNNQLVSSGVQNHYNDYGFLGYVTNIEDGNKVYEATSFNAKGQLKTAKLGNLINVTNTYYNDTGLLKDRYATMANWNNLQDQNYTWDSIGNLKTRNNNNDSISTSHDKTETFCYDDMNRLLSGATCHYLTSPNWRDTEYNKLGNITFKLGVGIYHYNEQVNGRYAGPHAVSSIEASDGSRRYFNYDNNGNMYSDGERNITYSTFDKPTVLSKGGHTTKFKYGPERTRFYREDVSSAGTEKTWYLGNVEKVQKPNGTIEWRRTLEGGGLYTYTTNSSGNEIASLKKRYILNDHLGSTDVIVNHDGSIAQNLSFDSWGHRRDALSQTNFTASSLALFNNNITPIGYTGHEMMDEMGLIHMNGRIYDPLIARFLQADPLVQSPTDTQSYNRYSYVRNNPLNAIDPSGYNWVAIAAEIVADIFVGVAVGGMIQGVGKMSNTPWMSQVGGIITCFYGTAACAGYTFGATYVATGSFDKALEAGVISAGMSFLSIGVTRGFDLIPGFKDWNQLIQRMIVGGTVTELTGGKFKNGAAGAAFMYGLIKVGQNVAQGYRDWKSAVPEIYNVEFVEGADGEGGCDCVMTPVKDDPSQVKEDLFTNGMLNDIKDAVRNGFQQTDSKSFTLVYNKTNGFIADLTESILGKLVGPSSTSQALAALLSSAPQVNNIVAHSQGTIMLTNAMKILSRQNIKFSGPTDVTFNGGAANYLLGAYRANKIGASFTPISSRNSHFTDPVSNLVGLNTINPFRIIGSIVYGAPCLPFSCSPHGSYSP